LPSNELTNRQATSPAFTGNGFLGPANKFFLSSIWMSGYGVAADESGNLYFATGNSAATSYDGVNNIQESVVKVSPDLSKVVDLFTPSNVGSLDIDDMDFGSGGVMLLPLQNPPLTHLAAAAGKDGRMFLLNRDNLGGYTPGGPDRVVGMANVGGCWCGPSYYNASPDGLTRIVSSGGNSVQVWKLQGSPVSLGTKPDSVSANLSNGQDGGFFTSVSSAGATEPIIWAVSRPENVNPAEVFLYAFNAGGSGGGTLPVLRRIPAGTWPQVNYNAPIVPVVVNGQVYVASDKQLAIFGLK
jgi:hypothetical protein